MASKREHDWARDLAAPVTIVALLFVGAVAIAAFLAFGLYCFDDCPEVSFWHQYWNSGAIAILLLTWPAFALAIDRAGCAVDRRQRTGIAATVLTLGAEIWVFGFSCVESDHPVDTIVAICGGVLLLTVMAGLVMSGKRPYASPLA